MDLSRTEHWIEAPHGVRLFALNVVAGPWSGTRGTLLFVHGSTWGALPTFDFGPSHQPDRNVMEVFARRGFDCWCVDMEGYGHSIGRPDVAAGIEDGARDLEAATRAIRAMRDGRALMLYGISAGALRAAVFAARHPDRVARLALEAFVWTGEGSPTLAARRARLAEWVAAPRRPISAGSIRAVFERDHPGVADAATLDAFVAACLRFGDTTPSGTYVDMTTRLPMVDPAALTMPVALLRGEFDGIAAMADIEAFFRALPNAEKRLVVMPGVAHASFQERNYRIAQHELAAFLEAPAPDFRG
jgi:pimeloyl-ACP methyl ester carboxylesterase